MIDDISLKERIENYLKRKADWVNGGEIERLALEAGYKASNASRRCREMESGILSDGKTCPIVLEKKIQGKSVWYRHLNGEVKVEKKEPKVEIRIIDGIARAVYA